MSWSMWPIIIGTLLVVDVRSGTPTHENVAKPLRCNQCTSNTTICVPNIMLQAVVCPVMQPHCSTTVDVQGNITVKTLLSCSAPESMSVLVSTQAFKNHSCSLSYIDNRYRFDCICYEDLCNSPFSQKLVDEVSNFTSYLDIDDLTDHTETFLDILASLNMTEDETYDKLKTDFLKTNSSIMVISSKRIEAQTTTVKIDEVVIKDVGDMPRAEALKSEATVPSDDDEDESEGSGNYDEVKSHRHPASPPSAPSSFLPAKDNGAQSHTIASIKLIVLFLFIIG